ncbi:hypothetical protein E5676_scaffold675G00350 [Cucumis melo var. makuwa]|uniref:Uncharacterized protein n=1 Tax=Cucumis melo var. makuwa TaxID=1194695 RepID=A0A5D3BZE8_CUCMM|nr:hypothetical protein E5676_scaffold675G00350 [Cucumis melo var. makuwa]
MLLDILAYNVVALAVRKMLMRRWWSVTPRSKNVNMARHCLISQVTHVILARANPRLLGIEAMQKLILRLRSQVKEGRKSVSVVLCGVLAMASRNTFKNQLVRLSLLNAQTSTIQGREACESWIAKEGSLTIVI